jgi:hypothetical protein
MKMFRIHPFTWRGLSVYTGLIVAMTLTASASAGLKHDESPRDSWRLVGLSQAATVVA